MARFLLFCFALTLHGVSCASPAAWYACDSDASGDPATAPDKTGHKDMRVDVSGASKLSLTDSGASGTCNGAIALFGNASSGKPLVIPHHTEIDSAKEFAYVFWISYWWGDATLLSKGEAPNYLSLYRGAIKAEVHNSGGGKTEKEIVITDCGEL